MITQHGMIRIAILSAIVGIGGAFAMKVQAIVVGEKSHISRSLEAIRIGLDEEELPVIPAAKHVMGMESDLLQEADGVAKEALLHKLFDSKVLKVLESMTPRSKFEAVIGTQVAAIQVIFGLGGAFEKFFR